jgi:hypothetical protein
VEIYMNNEDNLLQPQQLEVVQAANVKAIRDAKEREDTLASVVVTPAWDAVREVLESKASDASVVAKIRPLIVDATVTDAQLGALTRATFMAATEINNTLELVLETVKAHEK